VASHAINAASTIERLRTWNPDLVVTAGAPILGQEWLRLPRLGCINVHFGHAPEYRGEHTLFYPLLDQAWDKLGITIHQIDAGIDTGRVLAYARPQVDGNDDEASLWAKGAELARSLLPTIVRALDAGSTRPFVQPAGGRAYRYADRTIWDQVRYYFRKPIPAQPEHVTLCAPCQVRSRKSVGTHRSP
jgi:methionyl-tRNA formyltransferase